MMTSADQPDWLASLDATIAQLGTIAPRPFPPTPIPTQPDRASSDPSRNGAGGNGRDGVPDDREPEGGSGTGKPLTSKGLPALPVLPAPEKDHHEKHEKEVGTGNGMPIPTSECRARVEYQNEREVREVREVDQESIVDQQFGDLRLLPDTADPFPIIGKWREDLRDCFDERAAILEYDGGHARADAEALAFAECIAIACGPSADHDDQLHAADHLKAIGIAIPSGWRPADRR